ncbi:MAG: hypothetical protein OXC25_13760 [Thiotrichales bacterium]|nr:hypothetical protein [Thiotrichales bacterium]MCY4350905.1 hypothetical protein [Thiotrichales bacterium]
MKLLAIEMSRVTALFRLTRRSGQPYMPHIVAQVEERYRFGSAPHSIEELGGNRAEFGHGLFNGNAIEALEIYNDGIIVTSRSDTNFIDEFIVDLTAWLESEHDYCMIETHTVSKMYESILLVETDRDIFQPLDTYSKIFRMIEKALQDSCGLEIAYQNFGFALSADQTRNSALKPIPFRFERKEGIDFSRHNFFTTAPLKTKQHLEILSRLEQLW